MKKVASIVLVMAVVVVLIGCAPKAAVSAEAVTANAVVTVDAK